MLITTKEDYKALESQYRDPNSLMYRKLMIDDKYISNGQSLLDIGSGTGELIEMQSSKFGKIVGIDIDSDAVNRMERRFHSNPNVRIINSGLRELDASLGHEVFDCVTCLDVLEHMRLDESIDTLRGIYARLKTNGIAILSMPGIFDRIRISLGKSPTHRHGHSSYGWARMCRESGLRIRSVESIEFPLIKSEFLRKNLHLFGKCCVIVAEKKQ